MDIYIETFETWNRVAKLYQEKFMDLTLYNSSYKFVCDSIKLKNAKILEIGCGPGNISKFLLSEQPDFKILGLDIAPKMIKLAKKNNPTAHFKIMDARNISELSEKFDAVVCGFCLPYLSQTDSEKLIADSEKLLNENGILYLSFIEGEESNSGFQTGSTNDRCYIYYHNLEKLQNLLLNNRFQNLKVYKFDYTKSNGENEIHTVLIVQKK